MEVNQKASNNCTKNQTRRKQGREYAKSSEEVGKRAWKKCSQELFKKYETKVAKDYARKYA